MKKIDEEYGKICDKIDRVRIEAWVSIFKLKSFFHLFIYTLFNRQKNYVNIVVMTLLGSYVMNMLYIYLVRI